MSILHGSHPDRASSTFDIESEFQTRRISKATLSRTGDDVLMRRAFATCIAIATVAIALLAPTSAPAAPAAPPTCTPADRCCKVCNEGQACGDSCISRKKQCHKGRGCACNAAEICSTEP